MIRNKSVLAIIPARGGSKGLPGKNIKPVGGKPLIAWTIEAATKSKFIDRVVLSSDDEHIINTAEQYGCEVPFVRPKELAQDGSPAIEVVLHALQQLPYYDITVLLQPTCPLRGAADIDNALSAMLSKNAKSCVSVTTPDKSPYWMYTVNGYDRLKPLLDKELAAKQRQELPQVYVLNGAIYAIFTEVLLNTRNFVPDSTVPFIMSKEHSIDVDYQLDLDFVEFIMQQKST
ncbi:MAG: acylneuraminate cytidylyltransferase [Gammaproteobacteria bacterium SG8_11]|nr:MAG: acylneuraminate cytidylyltransferase [Gammaproteobacteria bacterium SG8_11]